MKVIAKIKNWILSKQEALFFKLPLTNKNPESSDIPIVSFF
jgi:hypothetical protein